MDLTNKTSFNPMDITNSEGYIKDSQENPPEEYCDKCGNPVDEYGHCKPLGNEKCINSIREPFEVMK